MDSSHLILQLVSLLLAVGFPQVPEPPPTPGTIVGNAITHTVKSGDSLSSLDAGSPAAPTPGLRGDSWLRTGQKLVVDNRHLVPAPREDGILINVPPDSFLFRDGHSGRVVSGAVGSSDWPTPLATSHIATKETDPLWDVPVSIQDEMRRDGQAARKRVAPASGVRPTS